MVSESKKNKLQMEKTNFSLYQYNRRKLKIAIEKNCISKELYSNIKTEFDNQFSRGTLSSFEEVLGSFPLASPLEDISSTINREIFKYNQIIIKLAQQFAKNTITQQLKLQNHDALSIQQANSRLQDVFFNILKEITNEYLRSNQRNIDQILLESGFIKESQLDFLHRSAEHLEIKAQDRKFGEIAVKNEFTTQEIVESALDEQTARYKKTSKNHIIGDILVEHNHITTETRDEILIIQNRVLEEDWEDTLKKVGQSSIEEREKNAMFGAMILKERLLDENKVVEALRIQAKELEDYRKRAEQEESRDGATRSEQPDKDIKPRWIGDILVQDFGLSEQDRKRIVKKQMEYKIERINLKLGLNLSNAHIELFNEMEQYFELSYSKDNIEAYVEVLKPVPRTMTKDNMVIWLYHKKIRYGHISNSISNLVSNKVRVGKKILLARGDEPVAAQIKYKFHFDLQAVMNRTKVVAGNTQLAVDSGNIGQLFVLKGTKLITFQKVKGRSGLNINRCFVAPTMVTPLNVIKGENVVRNENEFIASCDGVPHFSDKKVLSVSSRVHLNGDITQENLPPDTQVEFDCDFDIQGSIQSGVVLGCRRLRVDNLLGRVNSTDEVTVLHNTMNSQILSKGNIYLASVENCVITSEKSIGIKLHSDESGQQRFNKIYNSIITSDDIFKISDAKIVSSVIRAKNKVILKKVTIGKQCKIIVGDSIEVISCKKRVEELNGAIGKLDIQIRELQKSSRALFEKLEKKDIGAIEQQIKSLTRNQKTKDDLDKIAELRIIKRQKEKEYEASIDQYSSTFMKNAQQIKQYQDERTLFEKERKGLGSRVVAIYQQEPETPELDIRRTMLPAGTVIQFRYNQQELKADCEGFVFREEFNSQTRRYELKQQRW